jgi:hypothetical protein
LVEHIRLAIELNRGRFCGGDDCVETGGVGNCDFAEHFPVDSDIRLFKPRDKPAVHNASLPAGGGQSRYPKRPEITLTQSSAYQGVNPRPSDGLFGCAIQMA